MLGGLKRQVSRGMTRFAVTNRLYLKKRVYNYEIDEKAIRGKIQHVGHRMDLLLSSNRPVPASSLWEFEFLLDQVREKNVLIDDALLWAFAVYVSAKRGLLAQYYRGQKQPTGKEPGAENEVQLLDTIHKRRSVRQWTLEAVPMGDIQKIISLAQWAPSSCNRQLWKVLLINTEADKQFLTAYFGNTFWLKAPVLAIILMDSTIYGPHERHYAYLDGAAFIQNMLLAVDAFGYGGCWIGFARWDTLGNVHCSPETRDAFYHRFNLKNTLVPVSMIALGRPSVMPRAIPRQDVGAVMIKDFYE